MNFFIFFCLKQRVVWYDELSVFDIIAKMSANKRGYGGVRKMEKSDTSYRINMISAANKIKGQGVASAHDEQVKLVTENIASDIVVTEDGFVKADISHFHTVNPTFYLFSFFKKRTGIRVGYVHMIPETVESSLQLPRLFKNIFYKYMISFYKRMDVLVTVNPYFIDMLEKYGIKREKVTYIPNFVSDELFYRFSEEKRNQIKEKYGIPSDKFVVLCAGQTQVRKGIFDFIETAKRMPSLQFVWAGGFSFGKITDGYEKIKKIMENPPENVKFLGIVDREEMPGIYNMANVMFLPSFEELFPMTVLEAMSCRIPILLRDLEIYENILFDYYLKEKDVEGFCTALEKLSGEPSFYENAEDAAQRGHDFYSKEHVFSMWDSFYRSLLNP